MFKPPACDLVLHHHKNGIILGAITGLIAIAMVVAIDFVIAITIAIAELYCFCCRCRCCCCCSCYCHYDCCNLIGFLLHVGAISDRKAHTFSTIMNAMPHPGSLPESIASWNQNQSEEQAGPISHHDQADQPRAQLSQSRLKQSTLPSLDLRCQRGPTCPDRCALVTQ